MKKKRLQVRWMCPKALFRRGIIFLTLVAVLGLFGQAFADESITVSCYNLQKSEIPVGNVVVYDTSQAAGACNSMYYDCKGRCVGCFTDSDYTDTVCITASGRMFLK